MPRKILQSATMLLEFSAVISSSSLLLYLKIQTNWQRLWDLQLGFKDEFQNYLHMEKPLLNLSLMENQELGAWISMRNPCSGRPRVFSSIYIMHAQGGMNIYMDVQGGLPLYIDGCNVVSYLKCNSYLSSIRRIWNLR